MQNLLLRITISFFTPIKPITAHGIREKVEECECDRPAVVNGMVGGRFTIYGPSKLVQQL